jgi:hypothetical protein
MEFRCFQSCWGRVHDHGEGGYLPLEFDPVVDVVVLCKVSGVPDDSVMESLSHDAVRRLVAEVATYSHEMFSHRFEQAGSLYRFSTSDKFFVGSIISAPFYCALDDFVHVDNTPLLSALSHFRNPFGTVSDYLSSWIRVELYILSQNSLTLLSELDGNHEHCAIYPSDIPVYEGATTPVQRFSLKLNDFRLSNIW